MRMYLVRFKWLGVALALAGLLAACSQVSTLQGSRSPTSSPPSSPSSPPTTSEPPPLFGTPGSGTPTACQALYATPPGQPVVQEDLPYGQVTTLILSFAQDSVKARAVNWMEANLGLRLGQDLGVFENLPMVAVKVPVTQSLVQRLVDGLGPFGLVSVYADAPLEYYLNESVSFIGATQARDVFGVTGKGIGVAVIDSGIDGTHADFQQRVNLGRNVKIVGSLLEQPVGGYLYADLPNTDTSSGHGTHVASTIAGLGKASLSNKKYVGVAPGATLVGVGAGDALFIIYALQGFDFIMKPDIREKYNIRVVSNSWGSSGRFAPYHPISLAVKRAYDLGMIVVFAAGNSGPNQDTLNPYSVSPCAISVAAGDKRGYLADFSSRGIPGDPLYHPDITAPGVDIVAARASTCTLCALDRKTVNSDPVNVAFYTTMSGTSMATPHVSGTIALMLEANPELSLEGILDIFSRTARKMYYVKSITPPDGFDPTQQPKVEVAQREEWEVGYGYLNAYEAVRQAVLSNPTRFTLNTTALASWTGQVQTAVCAPLVDCAVKASHIHQLQVPNGLTALRVRVDWGNPAYDLDLYVYDPDGNLAGSSTQGTSSFEEVAIPAPKAGTWKVEVQGYLNPPTTYQGKAEGDQLIRR
jgi:serine protease AprX